MKKQIVILFAGFASLQAQNVNPFTGSMNYNLPLMYVPSDRGAGAAVDANYSAGIQMNQAVGEIGLGWDLSAGGVINRNVVGFPDDVKRYVIPAADHYQIGQGALYPQPETPPFGLPSVTDYDLESSKRGLDTTEFMFPGYDNYSISAPGMSGQMKLSYLKFYSYAYTDPFSNSDYRYQPNSASLFGGNDYYRKPQFHFTNDFADTLVSRHYPSALTSGTPFHKPNDLITGLGYSNSHMPYIGRHQNNLGIGNQNYDTLSGRLATSNLVEYFTNAEISPDTITGFIDYQSSHDRSLQGVPDEGIGYFRITASNGLTYHYALPVYALENTAYMAPLTHDYHLVDTSTFYIYTNSDIDNHAGNANVHIKIRSANKYAVQWLLTAVTGPDYVDSNNNHMADDGDAGYWVFYDYRLWSAAFITRSPYYGYENSYMPDAATQDYPDYFPFQAVAGYPDNYKLSGLYGTVNVDKTERYYLSKIRTSSHTAIFVRDVRNDEKGGCDSMGVSAAFKPAPDLLLKRVVLMRNEDFAGMMASYPPAAFSTGSYPQFKWSGNAVTNSTGFFTEPWYAATHSGWDGLILKHVAFDQDYSLCKKYYGNVNVNCVSSSVIISQTQVLNNLTVSDNANSGKLTLKRVLFYGDGNVKLAPSTKFDYPADNTYNPDFNPKKTDYWGYYKYDVTPNAFSRYATLQSKNLTSAWSLNKITDALGGITEIEYESNSYKKVIDNECTNGVRGAAFMYRVKSLPGDHTVILEEGSSAIYSLPEFLNLNSASIPGLKKLACLPFATATYTDGAFPDPYYQGVTIYKDFTLANNNSPAGSSNNYAISSEADSSVARQNGYRYTPVTPMGTYPYVTAADNSGITYSGNGFLMLETPVGYEVFGGGIRVKKIKVRNSASEVYVQEYVYEDGVALNEMDRFNYPSRKKSCNTCAAQYTGLQPKSFDMFALPPSIGYSKVSVKDMGQSNAYNGKTETTFITDPSFAQSQFSSNSAMHSEYSNAIVGTHDEDRTIQECTRMFSNIFGSPLETRLYDRNDNILSRTVNEYETTQQGGLVENFCFVNMLSLVKHYYYVNIIRDIPCVLKSSTSYGMGTFEKNETIARDELTGETTAFKTSGKNKSASVSYKTPAYNYFQAAEGLSFTDRAFRTILPLGSNMYTYNAIDTTLTDTDLNGYSASFLGAGYKLYSRQVRKRYYDGSTSSFGSGVTMLPYYYNNRSFTFDGGPGSMDDFGLLAKANLGLDPLNINSISASTNPLWEPAGTYNWRMSSEISLFDSCNHVVEIRDANNRFSASRYGYRCYYKSASATNCNYPSFTFADFESVPAGPSGSVFIDGDMKVNFSSSSQVFAGTIAPHTGAACIKVTSAAPVTFISSTEQSQNGTLEIGLLPGRIYRASVWVRGSSSNVTDARMVVTINGDVISTPFSTVYTANPANNLVTSMGNWDLLQLDFELPENFSTASIGSVFKIELKTISGDIYFDDFVFHPVESDFSASVYDQKTGRVMAELDGNGLATTYVYNAAGQITEVWKEIPSVGYLKVKTYEYNYARGAND